MEEQTSWKGHTFTLMVFAGIVVLSSIFFILGMLVGRTQGQKTASNAPLSETVKTADAKPEPKTEPKEDRPNLTFYDSVKKEQPAVLEPPPAVLEPPPAVLKPPPPTKHEPPAAAAPPSASTLAKAKPAPAPEPPPARVTSKKESVLNYQIGAVKKATDAEKLLDEVKKKGFRAFILSPSANDPKPFFRVQVGPFTDPIEAQDAKKKLESAGYQPILKK